MYIVEEVEGFACKNTRNKDHTFYPLPLHFLSVIAQDKLISISDGIAINPA
jgi:hypothetical protein